MKKLLFILAMIAFLLLPLPTRAGDLDSTVRAVEVTLRRSPVEIAVCVDPVSGVETARFVGSAESVRAGGACRNGILSHNHPGDPIFSINDVQYAELMNLRQLRATGFRNGRATTCVLTRPAHKQYYGFGLVTRGRLWREIETRLRARGDAAWADFFAQYGFSYRCERYD